MNKGGGSGITTGVVVGLCLLWLVMLLAIPFVLMLVWNATVPDLFHGPTLNYVQSFCIWVLFNLLTGGVRRAVSKS